MGIISSLIERRTSYGGDSDYWYMPVYKPTASGVEVGESSSLEHPDVWKCVRVISETIASLPLIVYRRLPNGGKERLTTHPLFWLLHYQPNTEMTSFQYRESGLSHMLLWGNWYTQIERARNGVITNLWPLRPDRMEVERGTSNILQYRYKPTDPKDKERVFSSDEILHIPGLGFNGVSGYSCITMHRETIGTGMAQREFGGRFFSNGALTSGVLQHPGKLSEKAQENLRKSITEKHTGLKNAYKPMILEEGMTWNSTSMPLTDAEYIESMKFNRVDICGIFRVPPHLIGDLERATFSNIEQQSIDFVVNTIRPWLVRIEQAINIKLFGDRSQGEVFCEHLVEGLLRGDIASRYSAYVSGRNWGWLSADDVRELENLNPLPEGKGKIYLQPGNMIEAGQTPPIMQPKPPSQPTEPEEEPEEEEPEKDEEERLLKTYRVLFEDVAARIIRREKIAIERAMRRTDIRDFENYLNEFYNELPQFIEVNMRPVLKSYENHTGKNSLDQRLGEYITFHLHDSSQEIDEFIQNKKMFSNMEFHDFVNNDLASWEKVRTERMAGYVTDRLIMGSS